MEFPISTEWSPALSIWISLAHEKFICLPQAPELGLRKLVLADIRMKPGSSVGGM